MVGYKPKAIRAMMLLIFAVGSQAQVAQQKPQLFLNVEAGFRQREPTWKIEEILNQSSHTESITFRQGKRQANVSLDSWNSPQNAHGVFDGLVIAFDNTRGKHVVKATLRNLGDENFMWANRGGAWPTIYFRKGSVVVSVFAPSVAVARRFAQHVLEQIDKSS